MKGFRYTTKTVRKFIIHLTFRYGSLDSVLNTDSLSSPGGPFSLLDSQRIATKCNNQVLLNQNFT